MTGEVMKFLVLTLALAACLLTVQGGPCHARPGDPAPALVLAVGPGKHVIKAGDTINLLALRYKVPAASILRANPGLNPTRLPLGKEIIIPTAAKAGSEPAGAPAAKVSVPTPSPTVGQGLELRPEKAPQATPQPAGTPKGHDLPDAVAPKPAPAPVSVSAPAPAAVDAAGREPAAKSDAAPSARETPVDRTVAVAQPGPAATPRGGWSMSAVWVLAGVVGVALVVAIALQGVLANVAAGCMLRLLRPFRPGDAVLLAGIVGRVEALGVCYVAIRSEAGERVLVPNAKAAGEIVVVAKAALRDADKGADRS